MTVIILNNSKDIIWPAPTGFVAGSFLQSLFNSLWLTNSSFERRDSSTVLTGIFHFRYHRRTNVPGITGRNTAILANVYSFGFRRRTQVRAGFRNLPTCRTGINGCFPRFCGFCFLLFCSLGHNKSPYQRLRKIFIPDYMNEQ